jgi:hypothetical protein
MESIKSKMKRLPFEIYERLEKIADAEQLSIEEVFQVLESRFTSAVTAIQDKEPVELRNLAKIKPFKHQIEYDKALRAERRRTC